MVWYAYLFQNFPGLIVIHTVKGFGIVNKAEIYVSLELSSFFHDRADIGNLISGSSAFSKTSLNISDSNEHPGLISFMIDWLDLLAVQGTLKNLLQHHSSKASILQCSAFFTVQLSHPYPEQCMISNVISAWSATSSVYDQPSDQ